MTYAFPAVSPNEIGRYSEPGVLITLCESGSNVYIVTLYTDFEGEIFARCKFTLAEATAEFTRAIRAELAGRAQSYDEALLVEADLANVA